MPPASAGSAAKILKNAVLDALFPIFCLSCGKEGFWLCQDCLAGMEILDFQVCPACEKQITDKGYLCRTCRDGQKSSLDGIVAAVSFENPAAKKLVRNFKYRFVADVSEPLAVLMARALVRNDFPLPDFLVPVPLHPRRLRWRGFNQSLLLADCLSENLSPLLKLGVSDVLERRKFNPPQMEIKNYAERLRNVEDIFGLKPDAGRVEIKNKKILLVDDICTTGATLEQCAKVLKASGARKVWAAVVARQSLKK